MIGGVLPYYLLGMLLLYFFAFTNRLLPMSGAVDSGLAERLKLAVHQKYHQSCNTASIVDHPYRHRWVGADHAQPDGKYHWRRLHVAGGSEGAT